MTFLNPWALALFIPIFLLFKDIFSQKHLYDKQTKLLLVVLLLLIITLSRPALENALTKESVHANEYIIALDISYSMSANDLAPSRYEVAKESIISLLENNTKDIFSIFAFTSNTILISPPTSDTHIAINALNALNPEHILTKGTSIIELLHNVSKLSIQNKKLIIFSDGGEEKDINKIVQIAKKSKITINIVALSSQKGATLSQNNKNLRDEKNNLVISRINPILQTIAKSTNGFYYEIENSEHNINNFIEEYINNDSRDLKKMQNEVNSYKELYYYPLLFAFITLLGTLTKLNKYIPFLGLIFFITPFYEAQASLVDFYYIQKAEDAYKQKKYADAIENLQKVSASTKSYYNLGSLYYKQKNYKKAMEYYSLIASKNPQFKQMIFYNMGNCALKMQRYERAKEYYKNALAFGYDEDAYGNLQTLYKLKIESKIDVADMMPHQNPTQKKNSTQKNEQKKDSQKSTSGKSNQKSSIKSSGSDDEQKKNQKPQSNKNTQAQSQYQMGYKAYELINKGYTNEKNPW